MPDAPPSEAANERSVLTSAMAPEAGANGADTKAVNRLLLFFALVYVVEGLGQIVGLISQPLNYYLKEVHGWNPLEVTAFVTLFNLPWIIKPIYGLISDFLPLLGYRRKSYLVIANIAATVGYLWVTQLNAPGDLALALMLIAYAMAINLFLLGAEVFKEFYSGSIHSYPMKYLYFGLHGKTRLVPWTWFASILNITAFFFFLFPRTRENFTTLNMACVFVIIGIYIEKGMGLVVPGFVPDTLGEVYEYSPTMSEILVTMGIWAAGAMLYTLLLKFAIPIYTGKLRFETRDQKGYGARAR